MDFKAKESQSTQTNSLSIYSNCLIFWRAQPDSNGRPADSKSDALSN